MSDHLPDEIERMNTRWMPLVAERLWLCSQADSQVALRRRVVHCPIISMPVSHLCKPFKPQQICIQIVFTINEVAILVLLHSCFLLLLCHLEQQLLLSSLIPPSLLLHILFHIQSSVSSCRFPELFSCLLPLSSS